MLVGTARQSLPFGINLLTKEFPVRIKPLVLAAALVFASAGAQAELPTPPQAAATQDAQAYLFHSGAGDVFEITTSMLAMQHSQNADVRAFAMMLIGDHTTLSNTALATAKGAGVMPPPPVLSPAQMAMITQLTNAGSAFDTVYLEQQVTAHQAALGLTQSYAANGDTPALRQTAATAVPAIQGHLARAQQLLAAAR
jgi:putative membrane protein